MLFTFIFSQRIVYGLYAFAAATSKCGDQLVCGLACFVMVTHHTSS